MKLFFVLSQKSLDIYTQKVEFEALIDTIIEFDKNFEISKNFEQTWRRNYLLYISKSDEIELQVLDRAGFTNTRIIAIWCRSWAMFENKKFVISQSDAELVKSETETSIIYSSLPNIGIKIR